jgi:hypothetical protein
VLCSMVETVRCFRVMPWWWEALSISETSVNFYQTAWCNIPEDGHLHTQHCENLKSSLYKCGPWCCRGTYSTFKKMNVCELEKVPLQFLSKVQVLQSKSIDPKFPYWNVLDPSCADLSFQYSKD